MLTDNRKILTFSPAQDVKYRTHYSKLTAYDQPVDQKISGILPQAIRDSAYDSLRDAVSSDVSIPRDTSCLYESLYESLYENVQSIIWRNERVMRRCCRHCVDV